MSRPRPPRKPSHLKLWQRLICGAIVVAPPAFLLVRIANGLLFQVDQILAQSAPLVSAFASGSLGREVAIQSLAVDNDAKFFSVAGLWSRYKRLGDLGTLPVVANEITIANGESLAVSGELAYARQVTAYVSVPALLSGSSNTAITRVEVAAPRLYLLRKSNGKFNLQELVKKQTKPPGPPFMTTIAVTDGTVRFEDRATKYSTAQFSDIYPLNATAILGARALRFDGTAVPKAGTPTANRLRGPVTVSGSFAQGKPGSRPDAAAPTDPQYTVRVQVPDADIPYFIRYQVGVIPNIAINSGRGRNLSATLVGGTVAETLAAEAAKKKAPAPSVIASGDLSGVGLRVKGVPVPLDQFGGSVRYASASDLVSFDITGKAFNAPVAASGSVFALTEIPTKRGPRLAVRFNAPQIPLNRVLPAFKIKLPQGISVGGNAAASGFLSGTPNDVAATAKVAVPNVALQGRTTVQDINADLAYGSGTLEVARVTARTDIGGAVSGSGRVRFGSTTPDGKSFRVLPTDQIASDFALRADQVSLSRVAALANVTKVAQQISLTGTANVVVSGSTRGKSISATADVATKGLTASGVSFSVAQARVVLRDNAIFAPQVRLESPSVGSLLVSGNTNITSGSSGNTPLSLQFAANALDAGRLARAFGFTGVSGVVNANGTVTGTVAAPQLNLARLSVMNPRYQKYVLQSVTGSNITVTKNAVTIPEDSPVVARRFPASVTVFGRVTDFLPKNGQPKVRPILALNAHAENIDYTTVSPFLAAPKPDAPKQDPATQLAGTLTRADALVTGYADNPKVTGTGAVRNVLLGGYPIDQGNVVFSYDQGQISIPTAVVDASAGRIEAKATITKSGYVYGSFNAPSIDLSRLSFLTEKTATLGGKLAISGTFSGTKDRPVITASIAPSTVIVAGIPFRDVTATNVQYIANLQQNVQRVSVPAFSLRQGRIEDTFRRYGRFNFRYLPAQGTQLSITNAAYDFKTKAFGATVGLVSQNLPSIFGRLRRGSFVRTDTGKQVVRQLDTLPAPLAAAFPATRPGTTEGQNIPTNRFTVSGIAGDKGITNLRVQGEVFAQKIQVGQYGAQSLLVDLAKGSDAVVAPNRPNIAAQIRAENIHIGNFLAESFQANGSVIGDEVTVTSGRLSSGTSTIDVTGTAGLDDNGRINALVDSNAIPLDLVRSFVPTFPVQGSVAVSIAATGRTKSPDIRASLEGQNLDIIPRTEAGQPATVATDAQLAKDQTPKQPIRLSLVRAIARTRTDQNGKRFVELNDVQVAREGGGRLLAEARVPFSYEAPYISATEPIFAKLEFPLQELNTLQFVPTQETDIVASDKRNKKQPDPVKFGFTDGTAQGQITLSGTLRQPNLEGAIDVTDARFVTAKVDGKETLNAIDDADARITLAGSQVDVNSSIKLGKPGGGRGDNGTLTISGGARIQELETALNALTKFGNSTPEARQNRVNAGAATTLDLRAQFENFEPVENNLLGLNEAFRARLNGTITASGPINAPTIATPSGQPFQVTNTRIVPPALKDNDAQPTVAVDAGPRFSIDIEAPGKNTVAVGGIVSADVSGSAKIAGSLGRPSINGTFLTEGGSLQYYLGRFTLDKGGQVFFDYLGGNGSARFENVIARTTVYLPPGVSPDAETSTRGGLPLASSQPTAEGRGTRYRITAAVNGRFGFGESTGTNTFKITPSSDPQLSETQIYALLVPRAQLASAASGDFTTAGRQLFDTAISGGVLPGLFAPIEQRVASSLGLEQFTVDYSPSAPLTINFLKRLPDPLDRFLVSYSRQLQSGSLRSGTQIPFTASLLYELYEIRVKPNQPIPRIQFGVSTNEQQDFSSYLRATIQY